MSRQINQPINQVRLTNVAVVRMNKGGKRFEIACYKNKVVNYRQGLEQDLSEVFQTERVFTNVSKGEFAKAKDLMKVFGTKDEEEIAKIILQKGQMQVSDKERNQQLEKTNAQIAEWIANNCVHPTSDRPYTNPQIRHAMQQANFSVHPTKPLKRQYLDCVKVLQSVIPIVRAKMELMLFVPDGGDTNNTDRVEEAMKSNNVTWDDGTSTTTDGDIHQYRILVDPSLYRILNEVMQTINGARIEIINQVVTKQGDVSLETQEVNMDVNNDVGNSLEQQVADLYLDSNDDNTNSELSNDRNKNQDSDSNNGVSDNSNDDGVEEEEMMAMPVSRKQQKKNRKKNNKQMRRAAEISNHQDSDGSDDSSDGEQRMPMPISRKQQEKARKKNKKQIRRVTENSSNNLQQQEQLAQSDSVSMSPPQKPNTVVSPSTTTTTTTQNSNTNGNASAGDRKSCNTCGGSFDSAAAYRAHFKSDWHRFNQKLKLKGAAPISEQEFLLCDSDTFFKDVM